MYTVQGKGKYFKDTQYDDYYLKDEGSFLYNYSVFCICFVSVIFGCVILLFSCGLAVESMSSRESVDNFFWKMDSIPDIIRKQ